MAYLGKRLDFSTFPVDKYTGNGVTTAYTLSVTPGSENACIVTVNGLEQNPGIDYTISGLTITFTTAPPNLAVIVCRHLSVQGLANVPASGSVVPGSLASTAKDLGGNVPLLGERILVTSSPVFGRKNKIINGNFDVWQRNTTFSSPASATYTADRWFPYYDGTIGTFTISAQNFTLGQTFVPGEPQYYLQWNQTAAGSGSTYRQLQQKIESVRTLAGQTCTVSFWAMADSARAITPNMYQVFGNGGSPSPSVNTPGSTCNLTTSWQKFSQTFTIPSISGKTLGTQNNDYLALYFLLPLNTTMIINIAQVQVEAGSIDSTFETIPLGEILRMCQRYYFKSFEYLVVPIQNSGTFIGSMCCGNGSANNTSAGYYMFPVPMRAPPTITYYNPSALNNNWRRNDNTVDLGAPTGSNIASTSLTNLCNSASLTGLYNALVHLTGESEL